MHIETIKYKGVDGIERSEKFYFQLTQAEILKFELLSDGGFISKFEDLLAAKKIPLLHEYINLLIDASYGEKSDDGRRFIKDDGLRVKEFKETQAYNKFFVELMTQPKKAAAFIKRVMPADDEVTQSLKLLNAAAEEDNTTEEGEGNADN